MEVASPVLSLHRSARSSALSSADWDVASDGKRSEGNLADAMRSLLICTLLL